MYFFVRDDAVYFQNSLNVAVAVQRTFRILCTFLLFTTERSNSHILSVHFFVSTTSCFQCLWLVLSISIRIQPTMLVSHTTRHHENVNMPTAAACSWPLFTSVKLQKSQLSVCYLFLTQIASFSVYMCVYIYERVVTKCPQIALTSTTGRSLPYLLATGCT